MHENQWTAMQTEMTVFANAQVDILKLVSFMTAVTILLVRSNRKSFARRRSRRSRVELPLGLPTESLNARMASEKKSVQPLLRLYQVRRITKGTSTQSRPKTCHGGIAARFRSFPIAS